MRTPTLPLSAIVHCVATVIEPKKIPVLPQIPPWLWAIVVACIVTATLATLLPQQTSPKPPEPSMRQRSSESETLWPEEQTMPSPALSEKEQSVAETSTSPWLPEPRYMPTAQLETATFWSTGKAPPANPEDVKSMPAKLMPTISRSASVGLTEPQLVMISIALVPPSNRIPWMSVSFPKAPMVLDT